MSAGMTDNDSMFSVREVPWHRHKNAVTLEKPPANVEEFLTAAGLDWEVLQAPVTYVNPVTGATEEDPSIRLNIHGRTGVKLGTVTKDYALLQNRQAFELADALLGEAVGETAGSLDDGRTVYMTFRLPDFIDIGGDKTGIYFFLSNHHGGWRAISAKTTAVRVVCQNTHSAAMRDGRTTMKIPHLGDPMTKIMTAREVLGMTVEYAKQFKEFGDRLADSKLSERMMKKIVQELWPEPKIGTERQRLNKIDAQNHVMWMYREAPTCVGEHVAAPESAWTFLNAITEFVDYGLSDSADPENEAVKSERILKRCIEDPTKIKAKAYALVGAAASN